MKKEDNDNRKFAIILCFFIPINIGVFIYNFQYLLTIKSLLALIITCPTTILSDAGVTYPNILPWDGLDEQLPFDAYPTTYFVDSEGKVIGTPVVGADPESYSAKLQDALEETGK